MAMPIVVSLRIATKAATSSSQMTRMPCGSISGCAARTSVVSVVVMRLLHRRR